MVWRSPCHSLHRLWTDILCPALCCRLWICCWRCDLPQYATVFYLNHASSPCNAACHRVSHLEMVSMKRSQCQGHFHQSPPDLVVWAHLEKCKRFFFFFIYSTQKNDFKINNKVQYFTNTHLWLLFQCWRFLDPQCSWQWWYRYLCLSVQQRESEAGMCLLYCWWSPF